MLQIVLIVRSLHERIRNDCAGNHDPAQHITVDLPQGSKIHTLQCAGIGILNNRCRLLCGSCRFLRLRFLRLLHGWQQFLQVRQSHQFLRLGVGLLAGSVCQALPDEHRQADSKHQRQQNDHRNAYLFPQVPHLAPLS